MNVNMPSSIQPALEQSARSATGRMQFSLRSLFEFTTICCLMAGLSGFVGIAVGISLTAFALSLATHNGTSAIIMLMTASLTAGLVPADDGSSGFARQLTVLLAATLTCQWYRRRSATSLTHV